MRDDKNVKELREELGAMTSRALDAEEKYVRALWDLDTVKSDMSRVMADAEQYRQNWLTLKEETGEECQLRAIESIRNMREERDALAAAWVNRDDADQFILNNAVNILDFRDEKHRREGAVWALRNFADKKASEMTYGISVIAEIREEADLIENCELCPWEVK